MSADGQGCSHEALGVVAGGLLTGDWYRGAGEEVAIVEGVGGLITALLTTAVMLTVKIATFTTRGSSATLTTKACATGLGLCGSTRYAGPSVNSTTIGSV